MKPHGNSKTATPFFTTAKKTREHIQELATKSTPKHVVQAVTSEQGGEINAKGAAFLPHIRQQVANFRRAVAKTEDKDILYSIMLELKARENYSFRMLRLHQNLSRYYSIDGKWMISCNSVPTIAIFQCLPLTQPSILVISLLHP